MRLHSRRPDAWAWAVAAIALLGAALRFTTLSLQSFWLDEAVTHSLVVRPLGSMLSAIPHSESTPPAYYVVAWVWVRVFGAGEAGLRSLSALAGVATIVLVALIARRLAGGRAAVAAAALAAANPLLVWYSQEARAYSLLVALCALSLLLLLQRRWIAWGVVAALALATHYFAVFIVVPELAWLLARHARASRPALWATAGVALVAAALAPLAIVQAGGRRAAFITASRLGGRVAAVPKQLLVGYSTPHQGILVAAAIVLAVALIPGIRRGDRAILALAAIALAVPLLLALAGADYLITRNLIAALVPLIVLAAVAATRLRWGGLAVAGLCAVGVVAFALVAGDGRYQRDNWRGVARLIASGPPGTRAIVVEPASGVPALDLYLPSRPICAFPQCAVLAGEVDVVEIARNPPLVASAVPLGHGFALAAIVPGADFTLVRYRAAGPTPVSHDALVPLRLDLAANPAVAVASR